MPRRLTPYQKVLRAFNRNTGVKLSPDDVFDLINYNSDFLRIANEDEGMEDGKCEPDPKTKTSTGGTIITWLPPGENFKADD